MRQIWERLGINATNNFYEGSSILWLEKNCEDNTCRLREHPPWKIIFPFAIWLSWKHRNEAVFRNQLLQPNVHKDALFRALEFQHCGLNPELLGCRKVVRIKWEKPQTGWAHLNTNGSAIGNPGRAGYGGLIRNDRGEWMGGFSRSLGCSNNFIAELWALRDDLTLCNEMHLNAVDIQLDAKASVQFLSNPSNANICAMPLLDDCRQLISQIAQVWIGHCSHEANSCADLLARIGTTKLGLLFCTMIHLWIFWSS